MAKRMDKLIGIRVVGAAYSFVEHLANESDRTVAGMARVLLYERLGQISDERQQQPAGTITDNTTTGAAAA